ncbi:hypothetical protein BJY54_006482 [Streptomyces nodosus]|nr:hypothetical protein [Streptomyces nodosus]
MASPSPLYRGSPRPGSGLTSAVAGVADSRVPAAVQPGVEALMAQVARTLRDAVRMW